MNRSILLGMTLTLAASSLGGCTDFRRALGIEKAPPDEFTVVQNAPLTLPPDYGLRPPHSAGRPATPAPMQEARVAIFKLGQQQATTTGGGSDAPAPTPRTAGENALLTHAGAIGADPRIRQQVDNETAGAADVSPGFIDSLLFWREPAAPPQGEPVDAAAETKRLRDEEAAGKNVTTDQPSVERTHRTTLEGQS